MKVICENYMNTLMNKFLGDEVNNGNEGNEKLIDEGNNKSSSIIYIEDES